MVIMTTIMILLKEEVSSSGETGLVLESVTPLAANVDIVVIEECLKMMGSLEGIHSAANVDTVAIEEYSKMMESSEDALWLNQEDKWRLFLLYDYKILLTYLNFLNYFVWLDKCLFYLSYTANIRIECWLKFGFWYKDHLRRPIWWFS